MKFTPHDRCLIHALSLLSRPPLVADAERERLHLSILRDVAPGATEHSKLIAPLVGIAAEVIDCRGATGGLLHDLRAAMNTYDARMLGHFWDQARRQTA